MASALASPDAKGHRHVRHDEIFESHFVDLQLPHPEMRIGRTPDDRAGDRQQAGTTVAGPGSRKDVDDDHSTSRQRARRVDGRPGHRSTRWQARFAGSAMASCCPHRTVRRRASAEADACLRAVRQTRVASVFWSMARRFTLIWPHTIAWRSMPCPPLGRRSSVAATGTSRPSSPGLATDGWPCASGRTPLLSSLPRHPRTSQRCAPRSIGIAASCDSPPVRRS